MRITFDAAKREKTLAERGLDFADAALIFSGITVEVEDTRKDYGEAHYLLRLTRGAGGRSGLYTAWCGSPHFQYEESQ